MYIDNQHQVYNVDHLKKIVVAMWQKISRWFLGLDFFENSHANITGCPTAYRCQLLFELSIIAILENL